MKKVQMISDCYQCRYGCDSTEDYGAWCHEASRNIDDMSAIPSWCPLPTNVSPIEQQSEGMVDMTYCFDVQKHNMGYTAGKRSAMYNLGDDSRPRDISPRNMLDVIDDMAAVSVESRKSSGTSHSTVKYYLFRQEIDGTGEEITVMAQILPCKGEK